MNQIQPNCYYFFKEGEIVTVLPSKIGNDEIKDLQQSNLNKNIYPVNNTSGYCVAKDMFDARSQIYKYMNIVEEESEVKS